MKSKDEARKVALDQIGPCVGPSKRFEFYPEGNGKPLESFKLRNNVIQFNV